MNQKNDKSKQNSSVGNDDLSAEPENDSSIEALVRQERAIARTTLSKELGREPTDSEIDRWLSEQTEGY